ncbi:hypothetical protein T1E_1413 [Pseudomonas putida DOT-T1E]|uniref:Uncharacterized protein n=1 Tax=Pseudomonas putida (strain DOT-T1E) TaxID=1196325 RepID=I7B7F1_PSEPT|nr:hypothetical protein T1E_1413 [Pseudomonas putida DOT-T1E]
MHNPLQRFVFRREPGREPGFFVPAIRAYQGLFRPFDETGSRLLAGCEAWFGWPVLDGSAQLPAPQGLHPFSSPLSPTAPSASGPIRFLQSAWGLLRAFRPRADRRYSPKPRQPAEPQAAHGRAQRAECDETLPAPGSVQRCPHRPGP